MLLTLLVVSFLVAGLPLSRQTRIVEAALQSAILVDVYVATRARLRPIVLIGVALLATIAMAVSAAGDTSDAARAISSAITILLLTLVLAAVVLGILRMDAVTVQTVLGAVCAYFCLGLIFSAIYVFLDAVGPEPFFGQSEPTSVFSYFSFVVLTTTGFGDYTAHTDFGRRVVVVEAIVGQIFLATAIARIVSLYRSPHAPAEGE